MLVVIKGKERAKKELINVEKIETENQRRASRVSMKNVSNDKRKGKEKARTI